MLFMVIEHFRDDDMIPVYKRVREAGRALPEGLKYIDSWVEPNFSRCFQLMECEDPRLLQEWVLQWRGTGVTFEFSPVVTSAQTRLVVEPYLTRPEESSADGIGCSGQARCPTRLPTAEAELQRYNHTLKGI